MKKVILFNGPPYCGKDTGASEAYNYIHRHASWMRPSLDKFSENMKKSVHAMFNLVETPEHLDKMGLKDEPMAQLLGKTPRELYISASEDWMKPVFGEDVFGRLMVRRMMQNTSAMVHIFSDSGFEQELVPIIDYVGAKNVLIIEVEATDCSFDGDSRGYIGDKIQASYPKVQRLKLFNDKRDPNGKTFYRMMCGGAAKKFLGLTHED